MKKKVGADETVPVCTGGTIASGSTSITFTNSDDDNAFTINTPTDSSGNQMPGWPAPPQQAPQIGAAPQGGGDSTKIVQLNSRAVLGTYNYTTTPTCPEGTPPKIVVS